MSSYVTQGAVLQCTQGLSPGSLTVTAVTPVSVEGVAVATVLDHAPGANVTPFGMCRSPANPQVAAATAAAMGVLTPQPCVPVIPAPWTPGAPVATGEHLPLLTDDSTCACAWAGTISVVSAGQLVLEG